MFPLMLSVFPHLYGIKYVEGCSLTVNERMLTALSILMQFSFDAV